MPMGTSIIRIVHSLHSSVTTLAITISGRHLLLRLLLGFFLLWPLLTSPTDGLCDTQAEPPPSKVARPEATQPKSWWVEPKARWWFPALHAKILTSAGGSPGTSLQPDSDLGIKTSRNFIWPMLTAQLAERHRVVLSYLPMQYGGNRTLTQNVSFAGYQFLSGAALQSTLNLTDASVTYQYDVLRAAPGTAYLSIQARYLEMKTRLQGTAGSTRVDLEKQLSVPIPTIGGGLRTNSWYGLSLNGDFNIFKMGISGYKGELIDSQVGLTFNPLALWKTPPRELCSTFAPTLCLPFSPDNVAISTGYRYFHALARDRGANPTQMDWLLKGPYLDISIKF